MGILDGIIGGIGAAASAEAARKGFKNAGNAATGVIDDSALVKTYAPAGEEAFNAQRALLGQGGDPAATQAAMDNYFASTGYGTALKGGNDAITSNMAAGLGNKSGAADKARIRFGTGLGQSYFDNYFSKLNGIADRGYDATKATTAAKSKIKWDQYAGAGGAKAAGIDNVFGAAGYGVGSDSSGGVGGIVNGVKSIFGF